MSGQPAADASNGSSLTPAEMLKAQHSAIHNHQPTIEDVVDESDAPRASTATSDLPPVSHPEGMSEKAAGKQRAPEPKAQQGPGPAKQGSQPLDTQSEEAFPSLGAPKTKAPAQASTWGRPPVLSFANGAAVNGGARNVGPPGSARTSGASTPVSGVATPVSPGLRQPPSVRIPGQHREQYRVLNSQFKKPAELKKPVSEILKEFNRRAPAKIQASNPTAGETLFTAQGTRAEATSQALRDLIAQICAKQKDKISIPASSRAHIIGRKGATIQDIHKKTGARVQIPKDDVAGNDDDVLIDVEVEGDPIAVALAKRYIDGIVKERSTSISSRVKDIPAELFPFLAVNERLQKLEQDGDVRFKIPSYQRWQRAPPPAPVANQPVSFVPQDDFHIQVSGDREAVRKAQQELQQEVEQLQKMITLSEIEIERQRHQMILGDKADAFNKFLAETGCAIIMPPAHEDSETLTIVGPADRIEEAKERAVDLAMSMQLVNIDVAKQHSSAPRGAHAHARDVTQYLQQRQAFKELEKAHDARVVFPQRGDANTAWQVFSREGKNAQRARQDIMNLINSHPPARFRNVGVHPFYQKGIRRQHARYVRDQFGVHLVFPEDVEEQPEILLVYEGPTASDQYSVPQTKPTPEELANFERALAEAEQYLLEKAGDSNDVVNRTVNVPHRFQEKVPRFVNRELQSRQDDPHPVEFMNLHQHSAQRGAANGADHVPVEFRGRSGEVDAMSKLLEAFVAEQIRDEAERGYTTSCEFPMKFANKLVGTKGENINKLRDEFDVEIKLNEGTVEIQGPKAKADAARAKIIQLGKQYEDETTHVIKIPAKFHRDLIGAQGANVNRLQTQYSVRINFPRSSPSPADDLSVADGASDAGFTQRGLRPAQAADEVHIRGPKRGADAARDQLLDLYHYFEGKSYADTISVNQAQLPSLIGQGGRAMEALRAETGVRIDVPGSRDSVEPGGRVEITLTGQKEQVNRAKKILQEKVKVFDSTVTRTVDVDKQHHRALIGRNGEKLRQIVQDAGGSDEVSAHRMIQVPKADSADRAITVTGQAAVVEKIVQAIEQIVREKESQVSEVIVVDPQNHGYLIGRGGQTRKDLEAKHNIVLSIPSQSATGEARSQIKVSGLPQDVETAKSRILELVKEQQGETIEIPIRLHHAIADGAEGKFFHNLRRDLRVTVDHAGQQKPARPVFEMPQLTSPSSNGSLPLITDEAPSSSPAPDTHGWTVANVVPEPGADDGKTIPWVLKGSDSSNVSKAKAMIEQAMRDAESASIGYLLLNDPSAHRYVIGPNGATINQIRADSSCSIQVPKPGAGGSGKPIEIRGPRDGVEKAREEILKAIASAVGRR